MVHKRQNGVVKEDEQPEAIFPCRLMNRFGGQTLFTTSNATTKYDLAVKRFVATSSIPSCT
jgi:hypothetical protein